VIKKIAIIGLLTILVFHGSLLWAQPGDEKEKPQPLSRILFVFDASQSMLGRWQSDQKINIAKKFLASLIDSLDKVPNIELALRVYGHQKNFPPQDCKDTKLEVPFAANNAERIKHKLKLLTPRGTTPIAYALEQTEKDFTPCDNCRNIIILITDGLEECNGDPCAASQYLQKKGIALKPFIIGIGRNIKEGFDCVGNYFDASSEQMFHKALQVVISQALNTTTAQVNLLDKNGKPTETNVNMTFYDNVSGKMKYNFIHTLNNKGIPDTLILDPLPTYDIVIQTIPPVLVPNVKITAGTHNIIPAETPQGSLRLKVSSNEKTVKNLQGIIRKHGEMSTLNVQTFDETKKYLIGKYDLEVLCLPRLYVNDVDISQSHTTTVEIPMPGIAVILKSVNGYGSIYQEKDNRLIWIYEMKDNLLQESLILQPGKYRVVFRSKYSEKSSYTIEQGFKIDPGVTTNVKLYPN